MCFISWVYSVEAHACACLWTPSRVCELFPFIELIGVNKTGARAGGGGGGEKHDNIWQKKKKKN